MFFQHFWLIDFFDSEILQIYMRREATTQKTLTHRWFTRFLLVYSRRLCSRLTQSIIFEYHILIFHENMIARCPGCFSADAEWFDVVLTWVWRGFNVVWDERKNHQKPTCVDKAVFHKISFRVSSITDFRSTGAGPTRGDHSSYEK